jgi:hypothetical protein
MQENEPVLLVLSVCDGEIILEKGEILCEKCHKLLFLFTFSSGCVLCDDQSARLEAAAS